MTKDTYRGLSLAFVLVIAVSRAVDNILLTVAVGAAAVALTVAGRQYLADPRCKACGRRMWHWTRRSYCNRCSSAVSG